MLKHMDDGNSDVGLGRPSHLYALALARNDPRLLGKTDHVIVRGDF